MLLASIDTDGSPPRLFGAEPPFALLSQVLENQRRVLVALSHPLADLDLAPGPLPVALPRGDGRPVPGRLGLLVAEPESGFAIAEGPTPFDLAPYDWSDLARRGRCADGDTYVTSTCGSTLSLPLVEPAPPRLTGEDGRCPDGWTRTEAAIERGPTLGPLSLPRCVPPARLACGPAELQAAGDDTCRALSPPCDPQDPYGPALPLTATISYVLGGRPAGPLGDGTRAQPFASLAEAMSAPRTRSAQALAIGRGTYDEDLELSGVIDVLGACTRDTVLNGRIVLRGHRGAIANITVRSTGRPALSAEASSTELRGVWAVSSATVSAGLISHGSRLSAERSVLESSAGGRWRVEASTLSLSHGELRGALALMESALRLEDVATSAEPGSISTLHGGSAEVEACRLEAALALEASALSAARSWFLASPAGPAQSVSSVISTESQVALRRSTFDHRVIQLSCPGANCAVSQVALVGSGSQLDAEDVLILAPTTPTPQGNQLASINLGGGGPYLLRRVMSTGGFSEGAITIADADVSATDLAIHEAKVGLRLNCARGCAAIELQRLAVSRATAQGIVMGGDFRGTAADLGAYDCSKGISIDGRVGAIDLRRASVVSAGTAEVGLERTTDSGDPASFTATLRSIDLRGPFAIALSVEAAASLDVSELSAQGADNGVVLRGPNGPRRLSHATIVAARNGISVDSTVGDLRPLLDHVLIRAPRPIDRGDMQ